MTEKEIMDKIETAEKWLHCAGYNEYNADIAFESVKQIVKHIVPKPCEDTVSRKAVLNLAKDLDFTGVKGLEYYKHRCIEIADVEDLPPVKPELSSLREMNSVLIKRVEFLENSTWCAVGPKQAVKYVDKGCEDRIEMHPVCPNCKVELLNHKWKFCPYCGTPIEWDEENKMSHTRYRIDMMMGHRVHLILKNGEEYHGTLLGRPSSKFGFMVVYDFHLNKGCISTCRAVDFVLSDIKKIELESEE